MNPLPPSPPTPSPPPAVSPSSPRLASRCLPGPASQAAPGPGPTLCRVGRARGQGRGGHATLSWGDARTSCGLRAGSAPRRSWPRFFIDKIGVGQLAEAWRCSRGTENGGVFLQIEGALWRGEAVSDRDSAGRSGDGDEGWRLRLGRRGCKQGGEKQARGPSGVASLSAQRAYKCNSPSPEPCSAEALAEMSSRCSQPRSLPGVPQGTEPASAKSAVGRSPFPRWVRGSFRSWSQHKLLGIFPEAQGGQGTLLPHIPPSCRHRTCS